MTPSAALCRYLYAREEFLRMPYGDGSTFAAAHHAALAFDQAVYDMGRRGYLGLPMVGPARQPRGDK